MLTANRPGEFEMIERFFRPLADDEGAFSLLDDAGMVQVPTGCALVMTLDALAADVHFFADDPAASIAHKALAVNVSDLAAKGARPMGYLVSLALPESWTTDWIADFSSGLGQAQGHFGLSLLGGDTIATASGLQVAITAYGSVPCGRMIRRSGARPGDGLYVSGTIGDAALGLRLRQTPEQADIWGLTEAEASVLVDRYLHPRPRVDLIETLRATASAAMDVSDGLVGDLRKLCFISRVSARVEASRVPLSRSAARACQADPDCFATALTGGDDYEVLFTVPGDREAELDRFTSSPEFPIQRIGEILPGGDQVSVVDRNGAGMDLGVGSYSHFRG